MRKHFVLLFILNVGCQLMAQKVVVSATEMRVFYQHIDNPVDIAIENCDCKNIVAKVDKGKLEGRGCSYIYRTDTAYKNREVILTVGIRKDGKVRWKEKFNIRVKSIPLPTAKFANVFSNGSNANKVLIHMNQPVLSVPMDFTMCAAFSDTLKCKLISYTFSIKRNDSIVYTKHCKAYVMNESFDDSFQFIGYEYGQTRISYSEINMCEPNDKIIFSNIMALLYQVEVRKLEDLEIIISN